MFKVPCCCDLMKKLYFVVPSCLEIQTAQFQLVFVVTFTLSLQHAEYISWD